MYASLPICPPLRLPVRVQWGFVNFRRLEDAQAAFSALRWKVIPDLTGSKPLKIQYRPV